ncbi:hypothetical protein LSH36_930g00030 [Paralvinella palmiformis]|uniref:U8 snoRNA-decapping enzyme n=1 Tax=Paralvinella palmiformis TaxID=53620 RepID=A0AAD9IXX8_9ANNE|nr:hypothetical protein LSH36_930g00030 [Paralvinella palmiformis]
MHCRNGVLSSAGSWFDDSTFSVTSGLDLLELSWTNESAAARTSRMRFRLMVSKACDISMPNLWKTHFLVITTEISIRCAHTMSAQLLALLKPLWSSFCDDPAGLGGHRVKIYVVAHPAMPAEQELKLAFYTRLPCRGGELGFPGGHIEHTDQSVIDGLNRELREEINIKRRHQLNQGDHVLTLVRHQPPFVEHFYIHEILPSEFVEIEKKVPGGHRWGIEIFGVIRVPLSVDEDGIKGFPSFLSNRFMHNARSLLIEGIQLRQLMHRKQLKELVRVSDRYLQKTSKTPQ